MTRWEYKSIVGVLDSCEALGGLTKGWNLKTDSRAEIETLGDEGWELVGLTDVGIMGANKNVLLMFKRPRE